MLGVGVCYILLWDEAGRSYVIKVVIGIDEIVSVWCVIVCGDLMHSQNEVFVVFNLFHFLLGLLGVTTLYRSG